MKKILITTLIVVALIGSACAVYCLNRGRQLITGQNPPLKIAINVWPGCAYAFVAQEKGIFKKNGVRVELILKKNLVETRKLYMDGQVDGIFEAFSDTVLHNLEQKPTKAVYAVDYSDEGDVIVGRAGLAYPQGLKGKKIGIDAFNSFSHLFVSAIIDRANMKPSDVTLVEVPGQDVPRALESGTIDAGHTWEPAKSEALAKGYVKYDKAGNYPGLITDVLSFGSDTIHNREADVQAVVQSLAEAADFVQNNPTEAITIMANAEQMSEEEMRGGLSGAHLLDVRENKAAFSYSVGLESLHGDFRAINDFLRLNNKTDKILDSTDFVEPRFVRRLQ